DRTGRSTKRRCSAAYAHQTPFIPAKAGIQQPRIATLGPRFRGDERKGDADELRKSESGSACALPLFTGLPMMPAMPPPPVPPAMVPVGVVPAGPPPTTNRPAD